ncbi:MAG: cobalamin-dependent protein [Kiritimatiellae bacterium]|nr:cobalamin-dependent protein [Kiritimatiellia bacterium]
MNIKLIAPAVTRRPMDSDWKTHMAPPLALLVLGALTSPEHRVTVVDECVQPLRLDDAPDLVGITVKADTFGRACKIAATYRRRGVRVVFGGIHPTACPAECAKHADAVVIGEAERLWPRLLADCLGGTLQPLYRNTTPVDPAETPIPRWKLLDSRRYLFTNTITAGRGCPWRCAFCYNSSPNLDATHRMKPVANILHEIASLGTCHVMFIDDNHDYTHYNTSRCVFRPARMTPDELERGYRWMYERVYSWEGIRRRWPRMSGQTAAYLQFNLIYRKFGKTTSALGNVLGMRNLARLAKWVAYGSESATRRAAGSLRLADRGMTFHPAPEPVVR